MSIDQEVTTGDADRDVEALGRQLGEAIVETDIYQRFEETRQAVKDHDDLQEQITEFEQQRQDLIEAQQTGQASQEEMLALQRTQQELHEHPTMAEFLEAKSALQTRLEAVNKAISDPLAVDFGGEAGGCCQD
ncbi:MAG: YlbF family regulator [Halobacteriaceae archaeon]